MVKDIFAYIARLHKRAYWRSKGLFLAPSVCFQYENQRQVEVKGQCHVGNFSTLVASSTQETGDDVLLLIGKDVFIGDQVNIRATGGVINIGSDVMVANQVTIVACNHGTVLGKPMHLQDCLRGDVLIEDDVWIGAGVVILPGAIIRRGAVVAAGAVVRGEVERSSIYGGIPAHKISSRKALN